MLKYGVEGNKIVERTTGRIVRVKSGRAANQLLKKLNNQDSGFQGYTPDFFASGFQEQRIKFR
jgi:hypothetical protein